MTRLVRVTASATTVLSGSAEATSTSTSPLPRRIGGESRQSADAERGRVALHFVRDHTHDHEREALDPPRDDQGRRVQGEVSRPNAQSRFAATSGSRKTQSDRSGLSQWKPFDDPRNGLIRTLESRVSRTDCPDQGKASVNESGPASRYRKAIADRASDLRPFSQSRENQGVRELQVTLCHDRTIRKRSRTGSQG